MRPWPWGSTWRSLARVLRAPGSDPGDRTPQGVFDLGGNVSEWVVRSDGKSGARGVQVQRYKGLGEMNPEQLWETTMNPETRTMRLVRLEDYPEANDIFTILMGEQVEPRREFIENNADRVQNLDLI